MLNQSGVKRTSYGVTRDILVDNQNSTAVSCMVSDAGVTANEEGKKIAKAGSPLAGDLTARETAFTVSGTGAVGILRHDVDVTAGAANAQCVIFGTIDLSKLEDDTQALITDDVKTGLKMVQFIK